MKHQNPLVIRKNTPRTWYSIQLQRIVSQLQVILIFVAIKFKLSYEDFNQNDYGEGEPVHKRYRITYYGQQPGPTSGRDRCSGVKSSARYGAYKLRQGWEQARTSDTDCMHFHLM